MFASWADKLIGVAFRGWSKKSRRCVKSTRLLSTRRAPTPNYELTMINRAIDTKLIFRFPAYFPPPLMIKSD